VSTNFALNRANFGKFAQSSEQHIKYHSEWFDVPGEMTYNVSTQDGKVGADMAFDQQKYKDGFNKDKYDNVSLRLPKGKKELLKQIAIDRNIRDPKGLISVNRTIINAIEQTYNIDLSKSE